MGADKKEYSNGEVTITWEADKCIHSGNCVRGLPRVFNPRKRPWIEIDQSTTQMLVEQVKKCPSKALGYYFMEKRS